MLLGTSTALEPSTKIPIPRLWIFRKSRGRRRSVKVMCKISGSKNDKTREGGREEEWRVSGRADGRSGFLQKAFSPDWQVGEKRARRSEIMQIFASFSCANFFRSLLPRDRILFYMIAGPMEQFRRGKLRGTSFFPTFPLPFLMKT